MESQAMTNVLAVHGQHSAKRRMVEKETISPGDRCTSRNLRKGNFEKKYHKFIN
jgi:hypothetical protein